MKDTTEDTPAAAETDLGTGTSFADAVKVLTAHKTEADPAGTVFEKLQFRALKTAEKQIIFKWAKVKNVKKYVLYGNLCGKNSSLIKVANISRTKKTVTVKKLTPTIKLSAAKKTLKKGKTYTLKVTGLAKGDFIKSFKSSKPGVAKVSAKGKITAKKKGKAVITVTLKSGKTAKCTITVK